MLRATAQRNDLVKQAGLNTDVTMLCALTRLCYFKVRQFKREELQQEQCRRKFERCRTGQPGANRQIAAHLNIKTANRNTELPQFGSDSEDVVRPTRVTKWLQLGCVYFCFTKTGRRYANLSIVAFTRHADHAIDRRA